MRILVPTDASDGRTPALERAELLALEHDGSVDRVPSTRSRRPGARARVIDEAARLADPDLVVVSASRKRWLRGALLPTTEARLARRARRNLLIVRRRVRGHYRKPLVCVDGGRAGARLIAMAAQLFPTAHLRVLHVYEAAYEGKLRFAGATDNQIRMHSRESRREAIAELERIIRESGVPGDRVSLLAREGDVPLVVQRVARRFAADVVVVGHRRSALGELFLGSVSQAVLRGVDCDVAVIRRTE